MRALWVGRVRGRHVRRACPSAVGEADWGRVAPCLTLRPATAAQRASSRREACNGLGDLVRDGVARDAPRPSRRVAPGFGPCRGAVGRGARQPHPARGPRAVPAPPGMDTNVPAARSGPRRSLRAATCWRGPSRPPLPMTVPRWPRWRTPCRRRPVTAWISPLSIRAIRENTRRRRPPSAASPGRGEAPRGQARLRPQARLRAAAAPVGGRARLRLDGPLAPLGPHL